MMALNVYHKSDIRNHTAGLMYGVNEFAVFIKEEISIAKHQNREIDPVELQKKVDAWCAGYKTALASNAITFGL